MQFVYYVNSVLSNKKEDGTPENTSENFTFWNMHTSCDLINGGSIAN
jgi:hypothetical protein